MATERLAEGTRLSGRYEIQEIIGRGGMGTVYRALDGRLDVVVAVKEMQERASSTEERDASVRQFEREAKLLGQLAHRNLPRVTDYFVEDSRCYLIMEFVNGVTIERRMRDKEERPSLDEVLGWGIQLADVLTYLHGQEPAVVFRDMKPSNIMLQPDGTVKLIDFGIARRFTEGATKDTLLYGSPGYSPPEQYGRAQTDARSDLYALGATLHHLVTGRDPAPTPFKFPPIRSLDPNLPLELEQVLDQCLQMDIEKRTLSAREIHAALVRIRNAETERNTRLAAVAAAQPRTGPRVITARPTPGGSGKARRGAAMVAAGVLAVAGIAWGLSRFVGHGGKPQRHAPAVRFTPPPPPQPPVPDPTPNGGSDSDGADGTTAAAVHVASTPAGATVLLDGKNVGITPCDAGGLAPGRHVVQVVPPPNSGLVPAMREVDAEPGDTLNLDVTLSTPPGNLPAPQSPIVQFGAQSEATGQVRDPLRPRAQLTGVLAKMAFRVIGAAHKDGVVCAFFYGADQVTPLKPRNAGSPFQNTVGQLSVSHAFRSEADVSDYPDFTLFVPEAAFPVPYDQISYRIVVFVDGKPVGQSAARPLVPAEAPQ